MNLYASLVRPGAPLMPEIVADPLLPSCYQLFLRTGIQEIQLLGPDRFLPRTREKANPPGRMQVNIA
jgi:hypothetical protein